MANQLWRAETNARPLDKDSRGAVRPKPSATTAVNATTLEECLASYAHLHLLHMSGGCRLVGTGPSLPSGPAVCERATPVPARCPCTRRHLAAHVRRHCCFTVGQPTASLPPPFVLPKRVAEEACFYASCRSARLASGIPHLSYETRTLPAHPPCSRPRPASSAPHVPLCQMPLSLPTRVTLHASPWTRRPMVAACRMPPLPPPHPHPNPRLARAGTCAAGRHV